MWRKYRLSSVRVSSSIEGRLIWWISKEETVRRATAMHRKRRVFWEKGSHISLLMWRLNTSIVLTNLCHGIGKKYMIPIVSAISSQMVHNAENKTMKTRKDDRYIHSLRYTQVRLPMQHVCKFEKQITLIWDGLNYFRYYQKCQSEKLQFLQALWRAEMN